MDSLSDPDSIYYFPVGCDFSEYHGKSVQFTFGAAEFYVNGFGRFRVLERKSGEQCIEITSTIEQFPTTR